MGNSTRRLKFLLFVICCGVFGGIRFVLEVGELHMNWDASDASPLDKLVCWFYPPNIQRKTRQTKREPMISEFWGHFCPTKTIANSIRGPISPFFKKNALMEITLEHVVPTEWAKRKVGGIFSHFFKGAREKPRIPHSWKRKNG